MFVFQFNRPRDGMVKGNQGLLEIEMRKLPADGSENIWWNVPKVEGAIAFYRCGQWGYIFENPTVIDAIILPMIKPFGATLGHRAHNPCDSANS